MEVKSRAFLLVFIVASVTAYGLWISIGLEVTPCFILFEIRFEQITAVWKSV